MCTLKQAKDYDPEYANWGKIPLPLLSISLSNASLKPFSVWESSFTLLYGVVQFKYW